MNGTIHLSGEAILYAVIRAHREQIYGVQNTLADLAESAYPAFIQRAEEELSAAGVGEMDFDGAFSLTPEFEHLIADIADAQSVVGADLRRNGQQRTLTIYHGDKTGSVLIGTDNHYELTPEADPVETFLAFLDPITDPEELPASVTVDTTLIQHRDMQGIVGAGCTQDVARLLLSAAEGQDAFLRLERATIGAPGQEVYVFYGDAGIYRIGVDYSETQELFTLTPMRREDLTAMLQTLLAGGTL